MPSTQFSLATIVLVTLACSGTTWQASAALCNLDTTNAFLTCRDLDAKSVDVLEQALSDASTVFSTFSLEIDSSDVLAFPVDVLDGYHIQEIRFSTDNLLSIPYLMLSHLDNSLLRLYAWRQNMSTINKPQAALPFKGSLQGINLSYNNAGSITDRAFSDFSNLTTLQLYDNLIAVVDVDDLRGLTNLRTLELERNRISIIATGAFADLGLVTSLNLSFNALQTLQEGAFDGLQAVTFIDLAGNPFFCDCDLQWLKDWLDGLGLLASSQASCFYPEAQPFANVDFCPTQAPYVEER